MTAAAQTPRVQYTGNGAQTIFSYPFEIVVNADLAVYVGTTLKTLTTDYTVSGAGNNSGGSVTFVVAPANGAIVTFRRSMSYSRTVDFQTAGPANAIDFNNDADKTTLSLQQMQEQINRTLRLGPGSEYRGENLEIGDDAEDRKGKVVGFDADDGEITLFGDMATKQFVLDNISASGGGSVTSVSGSGGTTGLTLDGGPITNAGTLTLDGTLAVANGGTGVTTSTGTGSVVRAVSPALTGSPTVPTAVSGDNTTKIASTAFVTDAVSGASGGATTGDLKMTWKNAADTGWIMHNDGTIGDASSSATYSNANAQALFLLLWANFSNTLAAVSSGRGANAAADWAAHKRIALPKMLGRSLALAGAGSGLTSRTLGDTAGTETVAVPAHTHPGVFRVTATGWVPPGTPDIDYQLPITYDTGGTTGSTGTGASSSTIQPTSFVNVMIKL